jgi:hypothetical protein
VKDFGAGAMGSCRTLDLCEGARRKGRLSWQ